MRSFIAFVFALMFVSAQAHEGDHDAPGAVEPKKGGIVRTLETVNLELVTEGDSIKIYVFDAKAPS